MNKQLALPFKYSVEADGKTEFKTCAECGTDEMHDGPDGQIIHNKIYCWDCYTNYLDDNEITPEESDAYEQKERVTFLMKLIYELAAKNEELEERICKLENLQKTQQ